MNDQFVVLPLAVLIGTVLGALGSGGAILALPILVYVAHLPVRQAVAVSQLVIGLASFVGTLVQMPTGRVVWREVLLFGLAGVPATRLGAWTGSHIEPRLLMVGFAGVMALAGVRMLRSSPDEGAGKPRVAVSLVTGLAVGFLTGLLGVGGGFLLVPALITFGGLDARRATATSLPVIALNTLSGAAQNRELWATVLPLALSFLGATLIGTFVGLKVGREASEARLRQGLGMVLILVGVAVGVLNR